MSWSIVGRQVPLLALRQVLLPHALYLTVHGCVGVVEGPGPTASGSDRSQLIRSRARLPSTLPGWACWPALNPQPISIGIAQLTGGYRKHSKDTLMEELGAMSVACPRWKFRALQPASGAGFSKRSSCCLFCLKRLLAAQQASNRSRQALSPAILHLKSITQTRYNQAEAVLPFL